MLNDEYPSKAKNVIKIGFTIIIVLASYKSNFVYHGLSSGPKSQFESTCMGPAWVHCFAI